MSDLENASREYQIEVERRAAELVRKRGIPPWDAIKIAQEHIRRERQHPSRERVP